MTVRERPVIGITMGDAAGIGPEVIVKALADEGIHRRCLPVVIGDYGVISGTARDISFDGKIVELSSPDERAAEGAIGVLSLTSLTVKRGMPSFEAGKASGLFIEKGVELAMKGCIDALVTAPINKESFNLGGYRYPGHTEFLASLTGTEDYAMMLIGGELRVVLLTTHCPLMEVGERLNVDDTLRVIRLAHRWLREYFRIERPRLALAALNPHAGEGGLFGTEESAVLAPAARLAREEKMEITDPLPSDTLFHKAAGGGYDAVICPYHDQGLIPLKLLHFDEGVNVTLGLPIIRTSPDHGTAYDIAGKGTANPQSMKAALITAAEMAESVKRRLVNARQV